MSPFLTTCCIYKLGKGQLQWLAHIQLMDKEGEEHTEGERHSRPFIQPPLPSQFAASL